MTNLEKLKQNLNALLWQFEALLALEKEKAEVLTAGDLARLDKIINNEQAFLMDLERLEKEQSQILSKHFSGLTISQIIAYHVKDGDDKTDFQLLLDRISETVKHIQKLTKVNQTLIKHNLEMINIITERIGLSKDESGQILDVLAKNQKSKDTAESSFLLNKKI